MSGPRKGSKTGPARAGTTPRGGDRRPRGRPPTYSVSDAERKLLVQSLRRKGKQTGKEWVDLFTDHLYSVADDPRALMGAMKLLGEWLLTKASEKEVISTHGQTEPAIMLPEEMPDPAKVVALRTA